MSKPFRPGEPVSAKKLNSHSAALAQDGLAGAPGSLTRFGSATSMVVHDLVNTGIVARMTKESPITENYNDNGTRTVYKYSWESIYLNEWSENWDRDTSRFGHYDQMPVYSITFGKLEITEDDAFKRSVQNDQRKKIHPYLIMKDPVSQRLFAVEGGGGSFTAKSNDLVLMILGDYSDYKDCDGVKDVISSPPLVTGTSLLCEPAYAWSAYKVCGYKFKKVFDMRTYKKWAMELNGGTTAAWRRFHPVKFGWDQYTDGPPENSATNNCAGVRFYNTGASALSCTCPTWLENTSCIKLKFHTVPRPCNPGTNCGYGCGSMFQAMDDAIAWDKQFELTLCKTSNCNFLGNMAPFTMSMTFQEIPRGGNTCYWGPSEFDPCNPCDGFGRMKLLIGWDISPVPEVVCDQDNMDGPGWAMYFNLIALKNAIQSTPCTELGPETSFICNGCDTSTTPNGHFEFIDRSTIKISCCSPTETADCNP